MSEAGQDDFYVGYIAQAPAGLAGVVRMRIAKLFLLAGAIAAAVTAAQHYHVNDYEYGTPRTVEGLVYETPYPMVVVTRPGSTGAAPFSRYLLVREGKFGAADAVSGLHGRKVRLEGSLITSGEKTLIELGDEPITPVSGAGAPAREAPAGEELGTHRLTGEIVDTKCYSGVMNPGNLKTHKACAIRCISGGIPPCLLVRDAGGLATTLLLVDGEGQAVNERVLDRIAVPLAIEGRVVRFDDLLVLYADPETYERL